MLLRFPESLLKRSGVWPAGALGGGDGVHRLAPRTPRRPRDSRPPSSPRGWGDPQEFARRSHGLPAPVSTRSLHQQSPRDGTMSAARAQEGCMGGGPPRVGLGDAALRFCTLHSEGLGQGPPSPRIVPVIHNCTFSFEVCVSAQRTAGGDGLQPEALAATPRGRRGMGGCPQSLRGTALRSPCATFRP